MGLLELFILAITQAITEFLPVSSSGHLIIISELTDIESTLAVDVMLHIGTLVALVYYFRRKLANIVKDLWQKKRSGLFNNLVISSVPAVILGFTFEDAINGDARSLSVVIVMLLVVGLTMLNEKRLLPKRPSSTIDKLSASQALGIGVAQSVALVPGTSRSGASIIGGRLAGLSNHDAADYAFLIGIPVIFGAGLKVLLEDETRQFITSYPLDTLFGVGVAAIFGVLAISAVLKIVKNSGLKWFGAYRVGLALALLLVSI